MTEKTVVPDALEQGVKLTKPTSELEDALLLAKLIHQLATIRNTTEFEMLGNLTGTEAPYVFASRSDDGTIAERHIEVDDGEATTPEGKKCKSLGQRLADLDKGIRDLKERAERESLLGAVNNELRDLQKQEYDAQKKNEKTRGET